MFSIFFPDFYFSKVEEITPQFLKANSISALILDVDNTLAPWGEYRINDEVQNWLLELKKNGIKLVLLSNGVARRLKELSQLLDIPLICGNLPKPLPHGFRIALKELNINRSTTAVVGDIVFTDILGANLSGLRSILIEPISKKDFFGTKFWRLIESLFNLRRPKRSYSRDN